LGYKTDEPEIGWTEEAPLVWPVFIPVQEPESIPEELPDEVPVPV